MYKRTPISEVLTTLMRRGGLGTNDTKLAKLTKLNQPTIRRIRLGKSKDPDTITLLPIAEYFGISLSQIRGEVPLSPMNEEEESSNVITGPVIKGRCPVISFVRAGKLCDQGEVLRPEDAEEWRDCPVNHSQKTFVLQISGDSMEPEYMDGTEIFVDPTVEAVHNSDVVVRTPDGRATFKRLQITPDGQYLLALNEHHPQRKIVVPEGTVICGVVIYSGRKRR